MKKILIVLSLCFLLTGCYNYRELNDLGIVTAIGIDYHDDMFEIMVQMVNPKKEQDASATGQPQFVTYKSQAKTLQDAFRKVVITSPKRIYGQHIQVMVISEEVAKNWMNDMVDFFFREPEVRGEFNIMVAKDEDGLSALTTLTPLTNLTSMDISNGLETNMSYLGMTKLMTLNDLMHAYLNPYLDYTIPVVKVIGDEEAGKKQENLDTSESEAKIAISGVAVFKNDKLVGYLNDNDTVDLNMLNGELKETILQYDCKDGKYAAFEVLEAKSDMESDLKKKRVLFKVTGRAGLNEISCDIDLRDTKDIDKMRNDLNKQIEKRLSKLITKVRTEYDVDIWRIRDSLYKHNPHEFTKVEKKWDDIFEEMKITVDVDFKLYEKGNLLGGARVEKLEN